jgi:hypothetical protein
MAADFPRPRLPLKAELLVPAAEPNRALMGTAFDYLFRFYLMRAMPFAVSRQWVAESAFESISRLPANSLVMAGYDFPAHYRPATQVRAQMLRIIARAKKLLGPFVAGEALSDGLIKSAINLAHCDTYYRAGRLDQRFGKPSALQVNELRRMAELTDWAKFAARRTCLLNPTFGRGSQMVGGADADVLLDDLLIDMKTTATLKIRTEDWRQLIAYAALNLHFPIGDGERRREIRRVGFYFSRFGHLAAWPLKQLVDMDRFHAFAEWLRDYLTEMEAQRLARREEIERAVRRARAERRSSKLRPKRRCRKTMARAPRTKAKVPKRRVANGVNSLAIKRARR